jgi:hypothetical protein
MGPLIGIGIKFGIQEGIPHLVKLIDKLVGKGKGLEVKKPLAEALVKTINSSLIAAGAPTTDTIPAGAEGLVVQEAVDGLNAIGELNGKLTTVEAIDRLPEILEGIQMIIDGFNKIIGRTSRAAR